MRLETWSSQGKIKTCLNYREGHGHAAVWSCHRSHGEGRMTELVQPRYLCPGSKVLSRPSEMLIPEMEV